MRILSLVTSDHANFYQQQVTGLRERGHTIQTVSVPGQSVTDGKVGDGRSISAYLRYYPRAVAAASGDYDIVHANYGLTGPPAVAQPYHPVVLTLWGSDVTGSISPLSRLCAQLADSVVVMSEKMAEIINTECHVIPHGVDLEKFRPIPKESAREEVGWNSTAYQVLFPYGPFRDEKNFPRAARIVNQARSFLAEPVELRTMSGVPHDRVPLYMNAADALLLTSKREGSPNTVKEALACNLPVIATDVGDVAQRLAEVAHSTAHSDDTVLARSLVETLRVGKCSTGRDAVADISLETQLDRIEGVYRALLEGSRRKLG